MIFSFFVSLIPTKNDAKPAIIQAKENTHIQCWKYTMEKGNSLNIGQC